MRYLILTLLFMGCESFGVFSHEHEGSCVWVYSGNYRCYTDKYTEPDCMRVGYTWTDTTCEEFCDEIDDSRTCAIDL